MIYAYFYDANPISIGAPVTRVSMMTVPEVMNAADSLLAIVKENDVSETVLCYTRVCVKFFRQSYFAVNSPLLMCLLSVCVS